MKVNLKTIRSYHRNGVIADETSFFIDKKHGLETFYDQDGKIERQIIYIYGIACFFNIKEVKKGLMSVNHLDDEKCTIYNIKHKSEKENFSVIPVKGLLITGICKCESYITKILSIYSVVDSISNGVNIEFETIKQYDTK